MLAGRYIHCRGHPIVSLLQSIETGVVAQDVVFVSQVFQPLTTPATFLSVEVDGAKELQRRCLRGGSARLSRSRVTQKKKGLNRFNDYVGEWRGGGREGKALVRFSSQVVPIVNDALRLD